MKRTIRTVRYQSPVGEMIIGSIGDRLCICDWTLGKHGDSTYRRISRCLDAGYEEGPTDVIRRAVTVLDGYFAGERCALSVPLAFAGSEFQCRVWSELMKIPYGTTITYGALARRIGNPKAVRAVASATGANPISIFVPCHRVVGSDHSLTGYAGGLDAKEALLALEARISLGRYQEESTFGIRTDNM